MIPYMRSAEFSAYLKTAVPIPLPQHISDFMRSSIADRKAAALQYATTEFSDTKAYYTSGEWRDDYEADERGELPPDMKRGVLSQDALYDLLEEAGQ